MLCSFPAPPEQALYSLVLHALGSLGSPCYATFDCLQVCKIGWWEGLGMGVTKHMLILQLASPGLVLTKTHPVNAC